MLLWILVALLILDAIALVVLVILQPRSQGGGMGSAFGASQTVTQIFGGKGGLDFLTKLTAYLSIVFVALIMGVNFYIASSPGYSIQAPSATQTEVPIEGQ